MAVISTLVFAFFPLTTPPGSLTSLFLLFLLFLPNNPPLEGSAPGSSVVAQLGSLAAILAFERGSVPARDAGGLHGVPETSAQVQVTQERQLGSFCRAPRCCGAGLALRYRGLAHETRVQEDEAPGGQVDSQQGKEAHGLPAEIPETPLEPEPELGHSRIIPDSLRAGWVAGWVAGWEGAWRAWLFRTPQE